MVKHPERDVTIYFFPKKLGSVFLNYAVITLSVFLTLLAFKILKKENFGLRIGILKIWSKNSVNSTHTATLEI